MEIAQVKAFALGCLELGSVSVFIGALWLWASVAAGI